MKTLRMMVRFASSLTVILPSLAGAATVVFTSNTTIDLPDLMYDGTDVVVSNCTLTVNGPHLFSSLLVGPGGIVTHSALPNGPTNWLLNVAGERLALTATNAAALARTNVLAETIQVKDLAGTNMYVVDVDYIAVSLGGGFMGLQRTTNSAIAEGSDVLVNYSTSLAGVCGLDLTVVGSLQVAAGGAIDVSSRGYGGNAGPANGGEAGNPISGGGGGHGGYGGNSSSNALGGQIYGVMQQPVTLGSGGGAGYLGLGGPGGGMIRLVVGDTLTIDGLISACGGDATNSRAGGGAGGSILIMAQNFAGQGAIMASGGAGEPIHAGGGGGGRIAIQWQTNQFTGTISAFGGRGWMRGGAGTVYLLGSEQPASLVLDNGGSTGAVTPLTAGVSGVLVTVRGGAVTPFTSSQVLGGLVVGSNSFLKFPPYPIAVQPTLTVTNNATIEAGAGIVADGAGYPAGQGAYQGAGAGGTYNTGASSYGGGGGYGGNGAPGAVRQAVGGTGYSTASSPIMYGGGGGGGVAPNFAGGAGGGLVRFVVLGSLRVDGRVSSDGMTAPGLGGGGGAGGSVWVKAGELIGTGTISANGGDGNAPNGGGGGGGRIEIDYTGASSNVFGGTITAYGGRGNGWGGAGTVYMTRGNNAVVTLDNGGRTGARSLMAAVANASCVIRGGAVAFMTNTAPQITSLFISSNSFLVPPAYPTKTYLSVSGDVTVEAGGGILADGLGQHVNLGNGRGGMIGGPAYCGGGGGYGGYGGAGSNAQAFGGTYYGSYSQPNDFGSGGGGIGASGNEADVSGSGGGIINMTVGGVLRLDGRLSANGMSAVAGGGGGSGGSISLTVRDLLGSGFISANGGDGDATIGGGGGGGGGGRIAIRFTAATNNVFSGPITAYGGRGYVYGGAGTVYVQAGNGTPQLTIDNAGHGGTNTVVSSSSIVALTVNNGLATTALDTYSCVGLHIGPNGWLRLGPSLMVQGDIVIDAGGGISADGLGLPPNQGQGHGGTWNGTSTCGGGGGYGGYGAMGTNSLAAGGVAYGSLESPSMPGSGGGGYNSPYNVGGAGGGVIRLVTTGRLVLNGSISANGSSATGPGGGGGSGGSVWLSMRTLSGSGTILANGGSGLGTGGGGGGGRIAIAYTTNLFTGVIAAQGGGLDRRGGAGTIYLQPANQTAPQLIVDNGNLSGTNTPFSSIGGNVNFVITGNAVATLSTSTSLLGNLLVGSNSLLTIPASPSSIMLTISSNATVAAGGAISANGAGNPANAGTGHGGTFLSGNTNYGGGGGNGGYGAPGANPNAVGGICYGTPNPPTMPGSGGGGYWNGVNVGGAGGGSVRLNISGSLRVDGKVTADGMPATGQGGGGGSGGSVWLTCGDLSGTGLISANGGDGNGPNGGGGGGGRVAIQFLGQKGSSFTGTMAAYGGGGGSWGGAGTVYVEIRGVQTQMIVDNQGHAGPGTPLTAPSVTQVVVRNGRASLGQGGSLVCSSLLLQSNGWLQASSAQGTLTVSGDAFIDAGSGISADGLGSPAGQGAGSGRTGPGSPTSGGGGGHAGYGAAGTNYSALGGMTYGQPMAPITAGSGGGGYISPGTGVPSGNLGGAGGGAVHLTVSGTLTLNGSASANGVPAIASGGGGGSGGSVWLDVGTLTGSGSILANGGSGLGAGGGGGGGRIALLYRTNLFTGMIAAQGGGITRRGGAGTIYLMNKIRPPGQVILDNGNLAGTNTPLPTVSGGADVVITGGAVGVPPSQMTLTSNLLIQSNGWVAFPAYPSGSVTLTVSRDVRVAAGGGIVVDGLGFPANQGSGAGRTYNSGPATYGGGGGHGGYGGAGARAGAMGGGAYGHIANAGTFGSGGGGGMGPGFAGGAGGGMIRLIVNGNLVVDGKMSAEGMTAPGAGGGGGAGGSIWLVTSGLFGSGCISLNGGDGNAPNGGGGGGGRLFMNCRTNGFTGIVSAYGGQGAVNGGAGTIYSLLPDHPQGLLTLDNGGLLGTNTPLSAALGLPSTRFDLLIERGAAAWALADMTLLNSLDIEAGGSLSGAPSQTNITIGVLHDATIAQDGAIAMDGMGFSYGLGPGAGRSLAGGGYGGSGGASATGTAGGAVYGSEAQPVDRGSAGGLGQYSYQGGAAGGGAIRLSVGGVLKVAGRISADGEAGWWDNSGGGSGGSIWVTAAAITGAGSISAEGGEGDWFSGGGGGGGRIALYSPANTYTGLVSVAGGPGAVAGQAGSIYLSTNLPGMEIVSQSPVGQVNNTVDQVDLVFSEMVDPTSISPDFFVLITPDGPLAPAALSTSVPGLYTLRLSFPEQMLPGEYWVVAAPDIKNLFGQTMSQMYTGQFSIALALISGTVTMIGNLPAAGVLLQPSGGLSSVITDNNGHYTIPVQLGWSGSVVPMLDTNVFVPTLRSYTNLVASMLDQDYFMADFLAPSLTTGSSNTGLSLRWAGIPGVSYQIMWSTNLVDWVPLGAVLPGTNGVMEAAMPTGDPPAAFFRVKASN